MGKNASPGVLCVGCTPTIFRKLDDRLRESELRLLGPVDAQEAVAVCVNPEIAVVILDGPSIRGQEWSVAKSLRMIRPKLPIVLLEERKNRPLLPEAVDAVVPRTRLGQLLSALRQLLNSESRRATTSE